MEQLCNPVFVRARFVITDSCNVPVQLPAPSKDDSTIPLPGDRYNQTQNFP